MDKQRLLARIERHKKNALQKIKQAQRKIAVSRRNYVRWRRNLAQPIIKEHIDKIKDMESRMHDIRSSIGYHRYIIQDHNKGGSASIQDVYESRKLLQSLGGDLTNLQIHLAKAQKELAIARQSQRAAARKLTDKRLLQEFDWLLSMKGVRAIVVEEESMSVYTDTIFIEYLGRLYEIGMFVIGIKSYINQYQDSITFENLSSTHPKLATHPHANGTSTSICLGTARDPIYLALKIQDFIACLTHILLALQSFNHLYVGTPIIYEWLDV